MARTKAAVRRIFSVIPQEKIRNTINLTRRSRNIPFTIKKVLRQMKGIEVKKSG